MSRSLSESPFQLDLNGQTVSAAPGTTILAAALDQGIDFPNRCRVGGCASCTCQILSGTVHQRTDTSYLLTAEQLASGHVLACQSEPLSDVRVRFVTPPDGTPRNMGQVIEQRRCGDDVTMLRIQMQSRFDWLPGQHVQIQFDRWPDVVRPYSLSTAPDGSGVLRLLIRHQPEGRLSQLLETQDLLGTDVRVSTPMGSFGWPGQPAASLLIATGTGIAPLLAMLHDHAARGFPSDVTVLYGARQESGLLQRDEIESLVEAAAGRIRFVPVLSAPASDWTGARGRLGDVLARHLQPSHEVYVCGQPAMVESVREQLRALGVPSDRVKVDRFDAAMATAPVARIAGAEDRPAASVFDYLKYFGFHLVGVFALMSLLAGGMSISIGLFGVLAAYVLGDAVSGDDTRTPHYRWPQILTLQLWLALPLVAVITFAAVWSVAPGDPFGFGATLGAWTGYDLLAAKAATSFGHHISGLFLTGLMIGMIGTIAAHELTHRTWDPRSMVIGRWLLAFSFDTGFSIEHVYGHHRYVSTRDDPATAPRGRNVYAHVLISTLRGNVSAHHIEASRLARLGLGVWHWRNAFLRGHMMSVLLLVLAAFIGGWVGALYFAGCALWGKALLEIVNYMEHYGLVRVTDAPVAPRHSWNTNRRISSWTMFNLTRHSHHHAEGEVAYQDLRPVPDAPMMVSGYLTTIVLTLVPPLWQALMVPKLRDWDRRFANADERALALEANRRSGIAALVESPVGSYSKLSSNNT
ncbi:MAG: fatty acid desaturase [Ahniella sp.]|nr:fatty acid desaturase [Ahniella sp.]